MANMKGKPARKTKRQAHGVRIELINVTKKISIHGVLPEFRMVPHMSLQLGAKPTNQ
jgi:hypothetical protein